MRLALASCALLFLTATHGGYGPPLRSECINTGEVATFIVMVREPREIQRLYDQMPDRDHGATAKAFTGVTKDGKYTLIIPALRGQEDEEHLQSWGHELAHIVCGHFHG